MLLQRGLLGASILTLMACGAQDGPEVEASTQAAIAGDHRDPSNARAERVSAAAQVWGRSIRLHVSDGDNGAWASIDEGNPDDETWLDRTFDGGKTWDQKLGKTSIPAGKRGWRTMMYSVDNPGDHKIGAVRACGKAGDRADIACTPWSRTTLNNANKIDAAATSLMGLYDYGAGKWSSIGWWRSANALTALIDYSEATGSTAYRWAVARTFDANNGDDFTNDYMDDTGWWGLAWVRAYDLTKDRRYLDMARHDADYIYSFKADHCGGGIWWSSKRDYKNAITNELFVKLSASIFNRTGDATYRDRATEIYRWFKASGMVNGDHLVNDGLDNTTCQNNKGNPWTYNQGVILGGLVELHRATKDASLLVDARALAGASTTNAAVSPGGILRETCESNDCGVDAPTFKGVYARNLGELDAYLPDHPYKSYLQRQVTSLDTKDRDTIDQYGLKWAGPFDHFDASTQHSALDALTAARK